GRLRRPPDRHAAPAVAAEYERPARCRHRLDRMDRRRSDVSRDPQWPPHPATGHPDHDGRPPADLRARHWRVRSTQRHRGGETASRRFLEAPLMVRALRDGNTIPVLIVLAAILVFWYAMAIQMNAS